MTEHDDVELERRVRASLDTHAAEVDTSVPVATRARAAARRHRVRWVVAGVVAAAAVAAVVVPLALRGGDGPDRLVEPSGSLPTEWRTEVWHGVSVDVPAEWGWGASPDGRDGTGVWVRCGEGDTEYVGRPIGTTDVCATVREVPPGDFVWLGSPVPIGTEELTGGYAQETVEVAGERVTVAAQDDRLRERILSSVAAQRLCPPSTAAGGPGLGGTIIDGQGQLESFELCAYSQLHDDYELVYGRELDARSYDAFVDALQAAPRRPRVCKASGDLVVLKAAFDDTYGDESLTRTWVVDLACGTISSVYDKQAVTPSVIDSWSDGGLQVSLPTFIGPQG